MTPKEVGGAQCFLLPPPDAIIYCNPLQQFPGSFCSWSTSHFSLSSAASINPPWSVCLSSPCGARCGFDFSRSLQSSSYKIHAETRGHRAVFWRVGCHVLSYPLC